MAKVGAIETGQALGTKGGVGGGKQKSTISPQKWNVIVPACISITTPVVVRNDGDLGVLIYIHDDEITRDDELAHLN